MPLPRSNPDISVDKVVGLSIAKLAAVWYASRWRALPTDGAQVDGRRGEGKRVVAGPAAASAAPPMYFLAARNNATRLA
jgi:hypothetical protein